MQVETLGGGITNHNFVVTVTGRPDLPWGGKYVMRIPGQGTDHFIDREREHRNHIAAAEAGVTPPILYTLEPEMCTVVPFIDGRDDASGGPRRPPRTGWRRSSTPCAPTTRRPTFANEIHVFDMIREYMDMARERRRADARRTWTGCSASATTSSRR